MRLPTTHPASARLACSSGRSSGGLLVAAAGPSCSRRRAGGGGPIAEPLLLLRSPAAVAGAPSTPTPSRAAGRPLFPTPRRGPPPPAAASLTPSDPPPAKSGLAARAVSGSILAAMAVCVILAGGWLFCLVTCLVVYQCTTEYYGFVTSPGIAGSARASNDGDDGQIAGLTPPVPAAATLSSALCIALVVLVHIETHVTAALPIAAVAVLSVHLLAPTRPRFAQLTSSVFGLFYCGYLPSFWVKLRHLGAPLVASPLAARWPVLLGGLSEWTVGLAATFTTVACIIAADTGAYFCGKALGRTPLSAISPKKTVEGAAGGAACAVATALAARACFGWPAHPAVALGLGALTFASSVFGDLLESVMKRDAGLKDAGDLIPGHGGLLDRLDSYMFTGAVVYFAIRFVLPVFGV